MNHEPTYGVWEVDSWNGYIISIKKWTKIDEYGHEISTPENPYCISPDAEIVVHVGFYNPNNWCYGLTNAWDNYDHYLVKADGTIYKIHHFDCYKFIFQTTDPSEDEKTKVREFVSTI